MHHEIFRTGSSRRTRIAFCRTDFSGTTVTAQAQFSCLVCLLTVSGKKFYAIILYGEDIVVSAVSHRVAIFAVK